MEPSPKPFLYVEETVWYPDGESAGECEYAEIPYPEGKINLGLVEWTVAMLASVRLFPQVGAEFRSPYVFRRVTVTSGFEYIIEGQLWYYPVEAEYRIFDLLQKVESQYRKFHNFDGI